MANKLKVAGAFTTIGFLAGSASYAYFGIIKSVEVRAAGPMGLRESFCLLLCGIAGAFAGSFVGVVIDSILEPKKRQYTGRKGRVGKRSVT